MRLLLIVCLVGCAARVTVVPDEMWKIVPPSQRAEMERAHATEMARTRAELAAAQLAATEAHRALAAHASHKAPPQTAAPGDGWGEAVRAYEQDRVAAMTRVDAATVAWLRATAEWRDRRVAEITAELAMMPLQYEAERARAVDRNMLGSDTYDTAEYRAQLVDSQARWFAALNRSEAAHAALQRAIGELGTAKDTYADLVRRGPTAPSSDSLRLSSWDSRARRHFTHGSDTTYLVPPVANR